MSEILTIPYQQLSTEALEGLIEEFVLREGTDYGHDDYSLESKRLQVLNQLKNGAIVILYDFDSQSCNLVEKDSISQPPSS